MTPALRAILLQGNRPALDLNFASGAFDSRITYSGGANATYMNAAGVLVASSGPRLDYDPVSHACTLLAETEAKTNLLLNSKLDGTNLSTQSVTVTAQAYTLSFYGTGTVTLSGTASGAKVGTGAYPTRSIFTFTPTAGTLTLTVTGTVQYAQLEAASFASSFIPTGGATVTRTAESFLMSGINFSSWYAQTGGTFVVEEGGFLGSSNAYPVIMSVCGSAPLNDQMMVGRRNSDKYVWSNMITGGVNQVNLDPITPSGQTTADAKIAFAWSMANDYSAAVNGGAVSTDTTNSMFAATQFGIANIASVGGQPYNGRIKRIRYWKSRRPDGTLQQIL